MQNKIDINDLKKMREDLVKQIEFSQNQLDKYLVYLSSGSIVVTGSFLNSLESMQGLLLLLAHWFCMLMVIFSVLYSYLIAKKNFSLAERISSKSINTWKQGELYSRHANVAVPFDNLANYPDFSVNDPLNKKITNINRISWVSMILGAFFLLFFAGVNIWYNINMTDKGNTFTIPEPIEIEYNEPEKID